MRHITRQSTNPKPVLHGGAEPPLSAPRLMPTKRTRARVARAHAPCLAVVVVMSALCPAVLPVWAQESSEIAKQAQNPHRELDFRAD